MALQAEHRGKKRQERRIIFSGNMRENRDEVIVGLESLEPCSRLFSDPVHVNTSRPI
jgi:hypothetical protein